MCTYIGRFVCFMLKPKTAFSEALTAKSEMEEESKIGGVKIRKWDGACSYHFDCDSFSPEHFIFFSIYFY